MKKANKNILLVTSRNIYENSGESSLVNRRSLAVFNVKNKKTDVIGIVRNSSNRRIEYLKKYNCYENLKIIKYEGINFINKIFIFRKNLKQYLRNKKPENIVISGNIYAFFYIDILKKYKKQNNVKYFYDIHGCIEELEEYVFKNKIIGKIIVNLFSKIEKNIIKMCECIYIVSNSMKDYIENKYGIKNKEYVFIPCGIDNKKYDRVYYREKLRKELNIKPDEKVCIYSGGTSKWQMLNESIDYYNNNLKQLGYKLVIFSKDKLKVEKILETKQILKSDIIIKSIDINKLVYYLSIGDVGIMYREKNLTNKVAFPNKFSEYLKGGLLILSTQNIEEQKNIILDNEIGIFIENNNGIFIDKLVKKRLENLKEYYTRCDNVIDNYLDYDKNVLKIKFI